MADFSEGVGDKSGVKIVVTKAPNDGQEAEDDQNVKSPDLSLDMSHDTTGPIADPDTSVLVNISTLYFVINQTKYLLSFIDSHYFYAYHLTAYNNRNVILEF